MKKGNAWFIIVNPTSGNNFVAKRKKKTLALLKNLDAPYKVYFTEYRGHEEFLVLKGVSEGYTNFISVGGDGTLHHVTNGALKQQIIPPEEIKIGVIPVGTGNDWIKNNNIPKNTEKAIEIINNNRTTRLDIGKTICNDKIHYFNILVGIGYDSFVVEKSEQHKKYGKSAYLIASILGVINFRKSKMRFTFNDESFSASSLMSIVGLGKYCGSGMRLTHEADAQDGLFDITLVKDISVLSLFFNINKLYNGKLNTHKKVDVHKTNKISIEVIDQSNPSIEADGELIGTGGFMVELLPQALCFIVGNPA